MKACILLFVCILAVLAQDRRSQQYRRVDTAGVIRAHDEVVSNSDMTAQMGTKMSDQFYFADLGVDQSSVELSSAAQVTDTQITSYEEVYPLTMQIFVPTTEDAVPRILLKRWREHNPFCYQYKTVTSQGPPGYSNASGDGMWSIYYPREPSDWDKLRIGQE